MSRVPAEQEGVPLHDVEEKLIHISHAEVGAYLRSLWGLSYGIVEAVAHHHHLQRVPARGIDMILTVYAANLLSDEIPAVEKGSLRHG